MLRRTRLKRILSHVKEAQERDGSVAPAWVDGVPDVKGRASKSELPQDRSVFARGSTGLRKGGEQALEVGEILLKDRDPGELPMAHEVRELL